MNIISTQYDIRTKSLEIYVSGCNMKVHCKNCHNPETWEFNQGDNYKDYIDNQIILNKLKDFGSLIENIMIFGGEPLDQNIDELKCFLLYLNLCIKKEKIWLFTRYELNEVPDKIKKLCHYIKTGAYIESLSSDNNIQYGMTIATTNQKIHKLF